MLGTESVQNGLVAADVPEPPTNQTRREENCQLGAGVVWWWPAWPLKRHVMTNWLPWSYLSFRTSVCISDSRRRDDIIYAESDELYFLL